MNINLKAEVGAKFKLTAHHGDGVPIKESGWSHNLVLDQGLIQMGIGTWMDRVCVGAGSSIPKVTDTALDSFIASSTNILSFGVTFNTTVKPYSYTVKLVYRFGEGVAAGNISQLGLGWSNNALWNKARVKDLNNEATTIPILSDEFLDVTSNITFYFPEISGSFDYLGKTGEIISTHTYTSIPFFYMSDMVRSFDACSIPYLMALSQAPTSVTDYGYGTLYLAKVTRPTATSCLGTAKMELSDVQAILGIHITTLGFGFSRRDSPNYGPSMRLLFTPAIQKLNTQEIELSASFSWGRHVA